MRYEIIVVLDDVTEKQREAFETRRNAIMAALHICYADDWTRAPHGGLRLTITGIVYTNLLPLLAAVGDGPVVRFEIAAR